MMRQRRVSMISWFIRPTLVLRRCAATSKSFWPCQRDPGRAIRRLGNATRLMLGMKGHLVGRHRRRRTVAMKAFRAIRVKTVGSPLWKSPAARHPSRKKQDLLRAQPIRFMEAKLRIPGDIYENQIKKRSSCISAKRAVPRLAKTKCLPNESPLVRRKSKA